MCSRTDLHLFFSGKRHFRPAVCGNGDFIYKGSTVSGIPRLNTEKMTVDLFKRSMTSDTVITWSELPDFEGTERNLPERVQYSLPDMEIQREKDAEAAKKGE